MLNPCAAVSILNLLPNAVDVVVAKLASSPRACANSFKVLRVSGAESTTFATAVLTYVSVANPVNDEAVIYPAPLVNCVLLVGIVGLFKRSL